MQILVFQIMAIIIVYLMCVFNTQQANNLICIQTVYRRIESKHFTLKTLNLIFFV